jgi:iron(III) transport system permease protein
MRRAVLTFAALLIAAIGLLPLGVMFARSVIADGRISLAFYQGILASDRQWLLIRNSFTLASVTTLVATATGLALGILLARTDLPGRRLFAVLFTVPLALPPYITAVSWFDILGRQGLLSRFAGEAAAEWTSARLFGQPGCVLVLASTFLPISMLLTMAWSRNINSRLEEAGRLSSGWMGVLRKITIPAILPGVLAASTLVFLLTLGEFGVPMFLRYDVFPVESFMQFSAFLNFRAAVAAAAPLAAVTLLVITIEWILLRNRTHQLQPGPEGDQPMQIRLGRLRCAFGALVGLVCSLLVVAPLSGLVLRSAPAFSEALTRAGDSLIHSLMYAALGASLITLLGWALGYLIHTRALFFWRGVDLLTLVLFAMPGTVIGIGLVSLWNRPATSFIYATPMIILLGYVAQYTALTNRITIATLAQIPPSMEEAARVMGVGWLRRMAWILFPLSRRGLLAAWLVAYIFCLRDLGISMLVYPPGRDTLPVRTFTLMANGTGELIAALCVLMLVATLVPLGLLGIVWKGRDALRGIY